MQDRSNRPQTALTASRDAYRCIVVATLMCMGCGLQGCGGAPPRHVNFDKPIIEAPHKRFARALRLAATGRVQARAGLYDAASESLRLSYRIQPNLETLMGHAEAAERAGHFGQAHAAWRNMLSHPMDAAARTKAKQEAERLAPMVPADHVPVLITVSPAHATITLERSLDGQRRTVRSDGVLWLKAGAWQASTSAAGYKRELSAFRVGRRKAQSFAVALEPGQKALRMAGIRAPTRPGAAVTVDEAIVSRPSKGAGSKSTAKKRAGGKATDPATQQPEAPKADGEGANGEGSTLADTGVTAPQPTSGGGFATWGAIATTSLGVAALGVGGYFGFNATQNADVANSLKATRPDYKTQLKFYSDAATERAQLANTLFIAGGALAAAGTVWWLLAPRSSNVAAHSPLRPSGMTLTGRGLVALWSF